MSEGGEEPRHHEECYACPIGGLFLTARTSPQAGEALDHLVSAASELVAAAKSMAEAAEVFLDQQRTRGPQPADASDEGRVQRIHLDDSGG